MVVYTFLTRPTPLQTDQIEALYREAGWWTPVPGAVDALVRLVSGSYCFLVAQAEETIVGMGRSIADGISDAYIQDVTVTGPFRNRGIATRIVALLVERLRGDGIEWIGLIAENDTHRLYRRLGFSEMREAKPLLYTAGVCPGAELRGDSVSRRPNGSGALPSQTKAGDGRALACGPGRRLEPA